MTISVKSINTMIGEDIHKFMESSDRQLFGQIERTAKMLSENHIPVVLISGPSGSGKTTSAHILRDILCGMGINSHSVSMDNYFIPFTAEEHQLLSKGKIDLESPLRIDSELLSSQIEMIIKGKRVEIPVYDFRKSERIYNGNFIQLRKNEIIIFEGIHALNNDVIKIDDDSTFRIYVSVRTRVKNDEIIMHPSKIRLLRRIIRDHINRGRSASDTLQLFESVQEGEHKYIMPYKKRADCNIDTFLPYELSIYRNFLERNEMALKKSPMTSDLIKILENVKPLDNKYLSENSLIHEFVDE